MYQNYNSAYLYFLFSLLIDAWLYKMSLFYPFTRDQLICYPSTNTSTILVTTIITNLTNKLTISN